MKAESSRPSGAGELKVEVLPPELENIATTFAVGEQLPYVNVHDAELQFCEDAADPQPLQVHAAEPLTSAYAGGCAFGNPSGHSAAPSRITHVCAAGSRHLLPSRQVSVLAVAGQNRIESLQTAVACEVPLAVQPEHVAPEPAQTHESLSALILDSVPLLGTLSRRLPQAVVP
jgi:hypothetical protein